MEHELIRERTLAGTEQAKAEGRIGGRKTVMSPERVPSRPRCSPRGEVIIDPCQRLSFGVGGDVIRVSTGSRLGGCGSVAGGAG